MNITSAPCGPATSRSVTRFPVTTSVSENAGSGVPSASMFDSVSAMR